MNFDFEFGVEVVLDFDAVDFDGAGGNLEVLVFASELIGTLAVYFDGAVAGRGLGGATDEI